MQHEATHEARLTAFALGADDLDPPAREAEVRAQLAACPACFELACDWLRLQHIVRLERVVADVLAGPVELGAPTLAPTPPVRRHRGSILIAAAAAASLAAGLAFVWANRGGGVNDEPQKRPAPAGTVQAIPAPAPRCGVDLPPRAPDLVLEAEQGGQGGLAIAPDGRILTGGPRGTARLWDPAGRLTAVLSGHGGRLLGFAFGPEGRLLTLADDDKAGRLFDGTGRLLAELPDAVSDVGTRPYRSGAFAPDGRFFTLGQSTVVKLWDRDGRPLGTLEGHGQAVRSAAFSPDGRRIVTAARDRRAGLFETETGTVTWLPGQADWIWDAGFSADGREVFTCSDDGAVRRFSLAGELLEAGAPDHRGTGLCRAGANGSAIRMGREDGAVVELAPGGASPVTLVPAGRHVVSLGPDRVGTIDAEGCALLWRGGRPERLLETPPGELVLSSDAQVAGVAGADGRVRIWRLGP
jgi:hypothetical protein